MRQNVQTKTPANQSSGVSPCLQWPRTMTGTGLIPLAPKKAHRQKFWADDRIKQGLLVSGSNLSKAAKWLSLRSQARFSAASPQQLMLAIWPRSGSDQMCSASRVNSTEELCE